MSKGRLTRQELGWLLTQEAQGAAERLRMGVQILKSNVPPPEPTAPTVTIPGPAKIGFAPQKPASSHPPGVGLDATLDALDDAMRVLSTIHQKPTQRGRRGRIDFAALIWEVAPEARVSIEPGSGTEVFGDEAEFRRMLQVLIGHGTGAGSAITIRRAGDDVKVEIALGPDSSGVADVERAWVARMALRFGGRYELEGGTESLTLPADGVSEQKEREALRKELDEARKQGEAYARELATVLSQDGGEVARPSTIPPPSSGLLPTHEGFTSISRLSGGIAAELRSVWSPVSRQLPTRSGDGGTPHEADERWDVIRRALARAQDFVANLSSVADVDPNEPRVEVDLGEMVRTVVRALSARAERRGVQVKITCKGAITLRAGARTVHTLLQNILTHGIDASPRDTLVAVGIENAPGGAKITVDDPGAALPTSARRAYVNLELEPGTHGRPTSVPLFFATELASLLGAELELGDAPAGGLRTTVAFGRR